MITGYNFFFNLNYAHNTSLAITERHQEGVGSGAGTGRPHAARTQFGAGTAYAEVGTRARLAANQLMTGAARIRDPHSATVRAIKPVYVKNFNSPARVTTGRAFLPREEKRSAPGRSGSARHASAPPPLLNAAHLAAYPRPLHPHSAHLFHPSLTTYE